MKNALLALVLLASSAAAQDASSWKRLEGQSSGIKSRRAVAVYDSAEFAKLWKEHAADAPAPQVNWGEEGVVAVFLGETQTAGVKVEVVVQQDMLDSGRLNVFYKEVRPASKPFAAMRLSYPYAIVRVRKAQTVAFEVDGRVSLPEKAKAPANPRDTSKVRILLETLGTPSFDGKR